MPNSNNFTYFGSPLSGSASNSNTAYLNANFLNTTEAATSNQGFTSTALTNPTSALFSNDDMPRYSAKTVWVTDLLLISDRTRWISNQPTYQIIWSEPQPHIQGYAWGNIRLKNNNFGKSVMIGDIGDGIAISGVIRNLSWIINPSTDATATAEVWTDGVDQSTTVSFGNTPVDCITSGNNKYNVFKHTTGALNSYNIHEYRLTAKQYKNFLVSGIVAYFENATVNIDQFPGNSYVTMFRETTTVGQQIALPSITGNMGGRSSIAKTILASYQFNTVSTDYINTVGVGTINTNLMTVTTGQGGSFPIGSGIGAIIGTSHYIGTVTNRSTDTLTVSPTLAFGVSGLVYRTWQGGPTFAISASLYSLSFTIDPKLSNTIIDPRGFGEIQTGTLFYSEPEQHYRFWGSNLNVNIIEGYQGVGFISNTLGFFQVDGNFCAAEVEIAGAGIMHGTFSINGVPAWGINEGVSAIIRKTVFTNAGPGWNSFSFSPGQSFINTNIFRINLYNQTDPTGMTNTLLGSFDTTVTPLHRLGDVANASLMPMGNWQRIYADQCYFAGVWARGVTSGVAGAVQFLGTSTNSALKFQYYGTDFEILGTAGSSAVLTLDGASIGVSLGIRIPVSGGATFHSVVYTHQNGNSFISGYDFLRPVTGEIKNNQNYVPRSELSSVPRVFNQSDTPRNPRDFDIWAADKFGKVVLMYLFGKWNQIIIGTQLDDPNDQALYKLHGTTNNTDAGNTTGAEVFNLFSWSTAISVSTTSIARSQVGDSSFNSSIYFIDGINTGGVLTAFNESFNKFSFTVNTNRTTPKVSGGVVKFGPVLVAGKGITVISTSTSAAIDTFNGTSWNAAVATASVGTNSQGCFVQGNRVRWVGGYNWNGTAVSNVHDTFDGSSTSTDTVFPETDTSTASGSYSGAGVAGGIGSSVTRTYTFNGSWSSSIAWVATMNADNGLSGNRGPMSGSFFSSKVYVNGGLSAVNTTTNSTQAFNGTSWALDTSSNLSVGGAGGGIT